MEETILDEFAKSKKNIKTDKLALFSLKDEQLTDYIYDSIEPIEENYWVKDGEYWGVIDKTGKFLVTMSNLKDNKMNLWKRTNNKIQQINHKEIK